MREVNRPDFPGRQLTILEDIENDKEIRSAKTDPGSHPRFKINLVAVVQRREGSTTD